jgi:DNA-binding GntR family transcriptional regulator
VEHLISTGELVKKVNGRLIPGKAKKTGKTSKPVKRGAEQPEDFFDTVARELVLKSLEGEPYFLREQTVAQKYGISRTIVRRIFHSLAGAGIIEHIPRRGWLLRPFDKKDLESFLQVREILELKAMQLAKKKLDVDVLKSMLAKNVISGGKLKIDNSIHSYLIEKSQNRYIKDFFDHYGRYYDILFACEDMDKGSAKTAVRQHRRLLKALINRDWKDAKRALSEHIHTNHVVLNNEPEIIIRLARRQK